MKEFNYYDEDDGNRQLEQKGGAMKKAILMTMAGCICLLPRPCSAIDKLPKGYVIECLGKSDVCRLRNGNNIVSHNYATETVENNKLRDFSRAETIQLLTRVAWESYKTDEQLTWIKVR